MIDEKTLSGLEALELANKLRLYRMITLVASLLERSG